MFESNSETKLYFKSGTLVGQEPRVGQNQPILEPDSEWWRYQVTRPMFVIATLGTLELSRSQNFTREAPEPKGI